MGTFSAWSIQTSIDVQRLSRKSGQKITIAWREIINCFSRNPKNIALSKRVRVASVVADDSQLAFRQIGVLSISMTESTRKLWILGFLLMTLGAVIAAIESVLFAFRTTCTCPAGMTCSCPALTPTALYLIPLSFGILLLILGAGISIRYYGRYTR